MKFSMNVFETNARIMVVKLKDIIILFSQE